MIWVVVSDIFYVHPYFDASIKHRPKDTAVKEAVKRLRQKADCDTIEGDGSSWDSCCTPEFRDLTENRFVARVISVLGCDAEVPESWMKTMFNDMCKCTIKGKANVEENKKFFTGTITVLIQAIRQSGHKGTSLFNWILNICGWSAVILKHPEKIIDFVIIIGCRGKGASDECDHEPGELFKLVDKLQCAFGNNIWIILRHIFEGDDSALTVSRAGSFSILDYKLKIESRWKSLGFRMKLIYPDVQNGKKGVMTFCGYNFLVDVKGPRFEFIPVDDFTVGETSSSPRALIAWRSSQCSRMRCLFSKGGKLSKLSSPGKLFLAARSCTCEAFAVPASDTRGDREDWTRMQQLAHWRSH